LTDSIPSNILTFLATRSRCCLLRSDGSGRICKRICAPDCPIPNDIQRTDSLDACLSRGVREEWIDLIRESICGNQTIESLVVLDGVGFELFLLPCAEATAERSVWILLLPLTDSIAPVSGSRRRTLRSHEWGDLDALSRCQLDTLRHITKGRSNQQIADTMHRSKRAVEWHTRHLHRLLGASTRESMARLGRACGLDRFLNDEWNEILSTRPARRSLEEFARADGSDRSA
jgi:DNA-binding CsgD family transcriptional regulator